MVSREVTGKQPICKVQICHWLGGTSSIIGKLMPNWNVFKGHRCSCGVLPCPTPIHGWVVFRGPPKWCPPFCFPFKQARKRSASRPPAFLWFPFEQQTEKGINSKKTKTRHPHVPRPFTWTGGGCHHARARLAPGQQARCRLASFKGRALAESVCGKRGRRLYSCWCSVGNVGMK